MNYKNGIDFVCSLNGSKMGDEVFLLHISRKEILKYDPRDEAPHMRANAHELAINKLSKLKDIPYEEVTKLYSIKRVHDVIQKKNYMLTYFNRNSEDNFRNERLSLYADSIEEGLDELRSVVGDKLRSSDRCYVLKKDAKDEYIQHGIFLVKTGRDISPIPLSLPPMSKGTFDEVVSQLGELGAKYIQSSKQWVVPKNMPKEKRAQIEVFLAEHDETKVYLELPSVGKNTFESMTNWLKKNGASYDPQKKAWYVHKCQNFDKFDKYLSSIRKPSVLANLEAKKAASKTETLPGSLVKEKEKEI